MNHTKEESRQKCSYLLVFFFSKKKKRVIYTEKKVVVKLIRFYKRITWVERSENVLLTGDKIEMASEEKVADTSAEQAIDEQSNKNELPATYEPPLNSPLTGCYLLIILGEPHSQQHKDIILQRLLKGKLIQCFQCCFFALSLFSLSQMTSSSSSSLLLFLHIYTQIIHEKRETLKFNAVIS